MNFSLVVPELIDRRELRGFSYTEDPEEEQICDALSLESLATLTRAPLSVQTLKSKTIYAIGSDANADQSGRYPYKHRWSALKCLYGEVDEGSNIFVLSLGKWYRVKSNFVEQVNDDVDKLTENTIAFPGYVQATIAAYPGYIESKKEHFYTLL